CNLLPAQLSLEHLKPDPESLTGPVWRVVAEDLPDSDELPPERRKMQGCDNSGRANAWDGGCVGSG
ncbi:MAG TPA: hypothetical protein VIL69_01480, partial [Roseomonas sp.]